MWSFCVYECRPFQSSKVCVCANDLRVSVCVCVRANDSPSSIINIIYLIGPSYLYIIFDLFWSSNRTSLFIFIMNPSLSLMLISGVGATKVCSSGRTDVFGNCIDPASNAIVCDTENGKPVDSNFKCDDNCVLDNVSGAQNCSQSVENYCQQWLNLTKAVTCKGSIRNPITTAESCLPGYSLDAHESCKGARPCAVCSRDSKSFFLPESCEDCKADLFLS